MPELGIRNQCIFIAVYASLTLLCAATMTSQHTGSFGETTTTRYVCSSCEKKGLSAFFVSSRAAHIHMSRCKGCRGSEVKKISVRTRPGDVIAGGSGGMGPCPPPQHQPPGINLRYTLHIPVIFLVYDRNYEICQVYTRYIPILYGIYMVYTIYMTIIYLSYDEL